MKFATVVIPHFRCPRWLQICVASLKAMRNQREFEILVLNNSPEDNSIKAIDNELGLGVRIEVIPEIMRTPGLHYDWAIDNIDTHWLFTTEPDIRFMRHGWLDWYASHLRDDDVGMVGWYWQLAPNADDTRHYITSGGTLYNIDMLRTLKAGCVANKSLIVSYGAGYTDRRPISDTGDVGRMITDGNWGPFAERRGFFHSYPVRPRPEVYWHDIGSWLFYRAECQWECVRLPGKIVEQAPNMRPPQKYIYYGPSESEAYVIHYCAGTVAHCFENGKVGGWLANCVEWWLHREFEVWNEVVPQHFREKAVTDGIIPDFEEELAYAKSQIS